MEPESAKQSENCATQREFGTSPPLPAKPCAQREHIEIGRRATDPARRPPKTPPIALTPAWTYTETFSYDDKKRVSSRMWSRDGQSYTINYQYNTGNQMTQMVYPTRNHTVIVTHDSAGRVSSIADQFRTYVNNFSYNGAGQMTGLSLGNVATESYGYDTNRMQLISQTATQTGGPSNGLMNLHYYYQAQAGEMGAGTTAGNSGQLMAINSNSTINGTTEGAAYTYDDLGRLVTSNQTSNGSSAQRRFAYDRWGNRTGMWDATSGGNQIQSIALQQSGGAPTNQIASVTASGVTKNCVYDANGNLANDGVHTYEYDAENRIKSVDGGATGAYAYDYQNRRIKKVVGSTSTHYVWEGNHVIAEHDATTGALIYNYVYSGSRQIARMGNGVINWYLNDRLSERLVLDANGGVIGRMATLPFGEDFGESGTQEKHHFTSYERDGESGTDYAVNRQYSQSVGRFMSADRYQQSQGASTPQSFNRYAYVLNRPVDYVDSLGLNMEAPHPPSSDYSGSCQLEYGLVFYEGVPSVGVTGIRCSGYPGGSSQDPSGRPPAEPCDVQIPTDANGRAAVAVLLGEATPEYRIGQQQYQNGDKPDHPTGETTITSDVVYAEMVEMVSVISNRARVGGFGGSSWEDVATSGGFLGYAQGDQMLKDNKFGNNGSPVCERLRRAVKATNYVAQSGPTDTTALYWRGVVQGRRRHRFVRNQDGATRIGDTDFF